MKSLETQVPPPLVMLSVAFLMWLVNRKQNDPQIPKRTAYLPLLAGLGLLASAAFRFFKQKTRANMLMYDEKKQLNQQFLSNI